MREELNRLAADFSSRVQNINNLAELNQLRIEFLGRKSRLAQLFENLKHVYPKENRARFGKELNQLKHTIEEKLKEKTNIFLEVERFKIIDISQDAVSYRTGRMHPITETIDQISQIFISFGFEVVEGPEIETEFNNFEALNISLEHPARDVFDTFYLDTPAVYLLRSHTSPVQIRVMKERKPPISIVVPGKVFRPDPPDASHSFMFHQIEGLMVADDITFSNLKAVLYAFGRRFFGPKIKMRFRPHYFPFTEPSAEVDISCIICEGSGCRVCGKKGWLEIMGAGMVNPAVFENVGYDPDKLQGFAFGMGIERIAMLKYQIDDIRLFFENDIRFLRQF